MLKKNSRFTPRFENYDRRPRRSTDSPPRPLFSRRQWTGSLYHRGVLLKTNLSVRSLPWNEQNATEGLLKSTVCLASSPLTITHSGLWWISWTQPRKLRPMREMLCDNFDSPSILIVFHDLVARGKTSKNDYEHRRRLNHAVLFQQAFCSWHTGWQTELRVACPFCGKRAE